LLTALDPLGVFQKKKKKNEGKLEKRYQVCQEDMGSSAYALSRTSDKNHLLIQGTKEKKEEKIAQWKRPGHEE